MQSFVTVARTLSFNAAAAQLFMSQSTLSRHISLLEKDLEVTLFERGKNFSRIKLTRAGEFLLPHIQSILDEAEATRRIAQQLNHDTQFTNTLTVGFDPRVNFSDFPDYMGHFILKQPGIKVFLCNVQGDGLFRWILSGKADVGITLSSPQDPADQFCISVLDRLPMCLAVHANVLQGLGTRNPRDILRAFPLYMSKDRELATQTVGIARTMGVSLNIIQCNSADEVRTQVCSERGVGIIYQSRVVPDPGIIRIPIPMAYGTLPIYGLLPAHHAGESASTFLADYAEFKKYNS